jgi:hypothetical protein
MSPKNSKNSPNPDDKTDPGGLLCWAKVGEYNWWPAKVLDKKKDPSFPTDADLDPPRPSAIPIRFFGTHEFGWITTKRALVDWDKHFHEYAQACTEGSFIAAVQEAQEYKTNKILPDVFYKRPQVAKTPALSARKRKNTSGSGIGASTGGKAAPAPSPHQQQQQHLKMVAARKKVAVARKKQRLQAWGLKPPDDSPFIYRIPLTTIRGEVSDK